MYRALSCSDEIGAPPEVDIIGIVAEISKKREGRVGVGNGSEHFLRVVPIDGQTIFSAPSCLASFPAREDTTQLGATVALSARLYPQDALHCISLVVLVGGCELQHPFRVHL